MRGVWLALTMLTMAGAASAEVRLVETGAAGLRPASLSLSPILVKKAVRSYAAPPLARFGPTVPVGTFTRGAGFSPFITAVTGGAWRGRVRRLGDAGGLGLSAQVMRARSVGMRGTEAARRASGFLASDIRYDWRLGESDRFGLDVSAATQRLPELAGIGRGKPLHVGTLYAGANLVQDWRFDLAAGWYRISTSKLAPLDHAAERAAGMPAAGRGMRLAFGWRPDGGENSARIGIELRDGSTAGDRFLTPDAAERQDRRALLRFAAPF